MTELSPQAQEVLWAFNRAASGKPDDWHYLPAIAAALRAAVEQCTYRDAWEDKFLSAERILAIAEELETNG